jgi:hypothetical protein
MSPVQRSVARPGFELGHRERILLPFIGWAGGIPMQETLCQITYAVLTSSLGASEFVLGLVVGAGFLVNGVRSLVQGESHPDESRS